jgi:hypothetical protein
MSYARMAEQYISDAAERELKALLDGWEQSHGPIIQKHRESRVHQKTNRGWRSSQLVETVDVHFERGAARLTRTDYGAWKVERDPDSYRPTPVDLTDPMLTSPAVLAQCPNLLESLRSRAQVPDDAP